MSEYIYATNGDTVQNMLSEVFEPLQEVVRCRDCKHWQPWMKGAKPECWAYGEPIETDPDGFCAWAVRRDA